MGVSLRTNLSLPFLLSSAVWKGLCGVSPTIADLSEVDSLFVKYLEEIRSCDEEAFGWKFGEAAEQRLCWTCTGTTGAVLALEVDEKEAESSGGGGGGGRGGGGRRAADDAVSFDDRLKYIDLCVSARLKEIAPAIDRIKAGAFAVVPRRALALHTWKEVEALVAGSPAFDIADWKAHTHYSGYACDDPVVANFWKCMESFTDEEKSNFVRFCWGRSRIPRPGQAWTSSFHITKRGGVTALPSAHTCFNSVELPPYETEDIMRGKLLVAINYGIVGILNT